MNEPLDELPLAARALLDADRDEVAPPPDAVERMWGAVMAAPAAAAPRPPRWSGAIRAAVFGSTMAAIGFGAGMAVQRALTPVPAPISSPTPAPVPVQVQVPSPSVPSAPAEVPKRSPPPAPPAVRVAVPAPVAKPPPDTDLATERALIEQARTALRRQDAEGALQALDQHQRAAPNGRMAEEREALRVWSLMLARRVGEAQAQAAAFKRQFPNSLLMEGVEAAVQTPDAGSTAGQ